MTRERNGSPGASALCWLMRSKNGQALFARTMKRKDTKPVDKMQTLETFVKSNDGGMLSICKHITNGGDVSLTEANFTKLAILAAKRDKFPDLLGDDRAFSKYFHQHEIVRKAHAIIKAYPQMVTIMPVVTGNNSVDDDDLDALAQLQALAEEQRKRSPTLTFEQSFAKVYAANPELARRERAQNRPRAG